MFRKLNMMMNECQNYEPDKRPSIDQILQVLQQIDPVDQSEQSALDALNWWKKVILPPLRDQQRKENAARRFVVSNYNQIKIF